MPAAPLLSDAEIAGRLAVPPDWRVGIRNPDSDHAATRQYS
jgi:hypothetical protein